jgi:hypothetical protein
MDLVLSCFNFAKWYIDDIILFNLTYEDHMHHLKEVFKKFNDHNFKLHLNKC